MSIELISLLDSDREHGIIEANRLLTICNACRYCEGYCPVFPAMTEHRTFIAGTLDYLANLCHQCTACYHACQYKPPHELQVNLPPALSKLRTETYANFTWPSAAAPFFQRNLALTAWVVSTCVLLLCGAMAVFTPAGTMTTVYDEPGAFYAVMPHHIMAGIAGAIACFGVLSLGVSSFRFGHHCGLTIRDLRSLSNWAATLRAIATLQHLGGGHGEGCQTTDTTFSNRRRFYHQLTMWGFVLCFLATASATVYELVLGRLSPFPYFSWPVILGTTGGLGLIIGPLGLLALKRHSTSPALPTDPAGLDVSLLCQLLLISATGLALLAGRSTPAMPWLLTVHLGLVYGFFLTLPFGKFVHGIYRTLALLRYNASQRDPHSP